MRFIFRLSRPTAAITNRCATTLRQGNLLPLYNRRTLYTDTIYPYPERYVNEVKYPGQAAYRETWKDAPWTKTDQRFGLVVGHGMWVILWLLAFNDPGALFGHYDIPDPRDWTNEELGIPPDDDE